MNVGAARILCVDPDLPLLETRCALLEHSGYDVGIAPPQSAETVLGEQRFDLLILRSLDESVCQRLAALSQGAEVLILEGYTNPTELLSLVAKLLKSKANGAPILQQISRA